MNNVKLYDIKSLDEENGSLAFIETPFAVNRMFYVYGVRTGDIRGKHAHKSCKQLLVCIKGAVNVVCDDGQARTMYTLNSPLQGLYIPPLIWAEQYYHSPDSMLVALASHKYDESDYIRDYELYRETVL